MSVLLPAEQAESFRGALTDYLTTTFAFADPPADEELRRLLTDPDNGIFRGPYVRLRAPFRPAADGWQQLLGWTPPHVPHAHQAAAWRRLSSRRIDDGAPQGPLPTLVTTGTGSGKTEAFLYPILDHVMRAKAAGETGIKALILYPMNALANDQARRLADLITGVPQLGGVRAALYTGQRSGEQSMVSPGSLITSRSAIRESAPDILLTNYKMLDQLLLRRGDRGIWQQSATSLRYLVLDEFHTYDGAQGTDVAMLLRRLALVLAREARVDGAEALGRITPVATSATLGDKGDPAAMIEFARTVFGVPFSPDSVITETRLTIDEWAGQRAGDSGLEPAAIDREVLAAIREASSMSDAAMRARAVLAALYRGEVSAEASALDLVVAHPDLRRLAESAEHAVHLNDLAAQLIPTAADAHLDPAERRETRRTTIVALLAALSQVRATAGYGQALDVSLHLWVRELTRLDRLATPQVAFAWADDGVTVADGRIEPRFPALYCRHCGRSGWGVALAPGGDDLDSESVDPRAKRLADDSRFRALIHAPHEATSREDGAEVSGLRWLDPLGRRLESDQPEGDRALPVLAIMGAGADEAARKDTCPSCGRDDGIRFVGSAIATMLSVAITTLFGAADLDAAEKKALVFTDSVQDAAHRAGFVQSRAHVFALRNAIRRAVPASGIDLSTLVDTMMEQATEPAQRYLLLSPEIAHRPNFRGYWDAAAPVSNRAALLRRVRKRLLFDVALEFGLMSRVGRTLGTTGTLAAAVVAGSDAELTAIGRRSAEDVMHQPQLDLDERAPELDTGQLVWWVRGVLERMRERGAIEHDWYRKYAANDGNRWYIWGGRPKGEGMPAFPEGRDAPAWPRVGDALTGEARRRSSLDPATSTQSWYAQWARDTLGVPAQIGAHLTRTLFRELERAGIVTGTPTASGGTAYAVPAERVRVVQIERDEWVEGHHALSCPVCETRVVAPRDVIAVLTGAPCTSPRCAGVLVERRESDNFYRRLYTEGDMRRVVAREHTGLLADEVRLEYETKFKSSADAPDAPNVLVATPTLEMGIDIGDLSTVMLAGIPKSVAGYLQRVGRAGRLTGNALNLAFVTGRGDQLPRLEEPLSVIEGAVRPPATYLNAEEILQRQYIASLIDRMASDLSVTAPRTASDALGSAESGTFLGELVHRAEEHREEYLNEFLGTFDTLDEWAVESLRTWAAPVDGPGSSGLAELVYTAAQRWQQRLQALGYRLDEIDAALPELEAKAKHPSPVEDDVIDHRAAVSAHKGIRAQLARMRTEHWVSALEAVGVLPNYTLLDDSVQLDVALSWYDPDTNTYESSSDTYTRGAGMAIRELVPGATFYAHGLEIAVDAVELGADGGDVHTWQLCAACGYAHDIDETGTQIAVCPRCGDTGLADVGQRMPIAALERVSAEVRRDEATIDDRRDERSRQQFTIIATADIDPDHIATQWHVDGTGFGVRYCREVDVRWLNLGPQAAGGQPRAIAGSEVRAPLFRVCSSCGKLDRSTNTNSRSEHRAWCPHRSSPQEHTRQIALMRRLRTQGLVVRVPSSVVLDQGPAMTSFTAAILLGLRETIGGDPDHLSVETIVDPDSSGDGAHATALLLHDTVPGGTGYLADLAAPDRMRAVLEAALDHLRGCPCAEEERNACPRCLLPFAGRAAKNVSRLSAIRTLEKLLGEDGSPHEWDVRHEAPPKSEPPLESFFRKVFEERMRALSASIVHTTDATGQRITATLPGGHIWILREQVDFGVTRPDFVLERHGDPQRIAIYTDGFQYHATTTHNRIADDAAKRRWMRDQGHIVFSVTWDDLVEASATTRPALPAWFAESKAKTLASMWKIPADRVDYVASNPIDQVMSYVQDPSSLELWQRMGTVLPMLLWNPPTQYRVSDAGLPAWGSALLDGLNAEKAAGGVSNGAFTHVGAVALAGRLHPDLTVEAALVLDDRTDALLAPGFIDQWKLWLRWSNVVGLAPSTVSHWVGARSETESGAGSESGAVQRVPEVWSELGPLATDIERQLLASVGANDLPLPALGHETGDGIPLAVCWPDRKIVLDHDLADDERQDLLAAGWTIVVPQPEAVRTALEND
ncbi:DEAD/DEAH box helicase [Salinibacterium sp. ZJ70]|uniref:DEAD/DEAH box helicase n=1 Tax=Salinibacterium sp. ZJ70 TaxID=2708084 RepID=UPI0014206A58|nr:DEAD/DEAH box helicase [Salinibacterium sp. ZJ70]